MASKTPCALWTLLAFAGCEATSGGDAWSPDRSDDTLEDSDSDSDSDSEDGASPGEPHTELFSQPALLGMHSPPWNDLAPMHELFGGARGWLLDVVYSTDFDWVDGRFSDAAAAGYEVVVRVDYARIDHSGFADGSHTFGATIPPPGEVGWCLLRRDPHSGNGPSRHVGNGTHLDCYLAYLEDLVLSNPQVHDWVIGNEMNIAFEAKGFPGGVIVPGWYAQVYAAARARIRSLPGHHADRVFLGGVSPGSANTVKTHGGNEYLGAVLQHLAPSEVDAITIHAYGGWPQPQHNGGVLAKDLFRSTYVDQLHLIDAHGHGCTPVLISEFSVNTHMSSEGDDPGIHDEPHTAAFLADAIQELYEWNAGPNNHPVLGAVWFTWNDRHAFARESMSVFFDRRWLASQTPHNNPALRFTQIAPVYPSPAPACGEANLPPPPPPPPGPSCPCIEGVDNVCFYLADHAGCRDLMGGKHACATDQDWVDGWLLYNDVLSCVQPQPQPQPQPQTCPCLGGVDNFCSYGPAYTGCAMTFPGGYCDPNGDSDFSDGDWGRGWVEYHEQCT